MQVQKMEEVKNKNPKLGNKEVELLNFLKLNEGKVWQQDILDKFSWAATYDKVLLRRLHRLEQKGLISISQEINPKTKRLKKKVYLVK